MSAHRECLEAAAEIVRRNDHVCMSCGGELVPQGCAPYCEDSRRCSDNEDGHLDGHRPAFEVLLQHAAAAPAAPQVVTLDDFEATFTREDLAAVIKHVATDGELWRRARKQAQALGFERGNQDAIDAVRHLLAWELRAKETEPRAPQVVDRDGVLEEVLSVLRRKRGPFHESYVLRSTVRDVLDELLAEVRALKAPSPPAAAPPTSRELTCEDVGCPKCCPPTPSAPPPTGGRTAGEAEADVVAWLRLLAKEHDTAADAFPQIAQEQASRADQNRSMADGIEAGDHIGSSRSPAGTGKEGAERDSGVCHIAGPMDGKAQRCTRCGGVLVDWRRTEGQPPGSRGFGEGRIVYVNGNVMMVIDPKDVVAWCSTGSGLTSPAGAGKWR